MLLQNLDRASSSWTQPRLQCWIGSDPKLSQFAPTPSTFWRAKKQLGKGRWEWDHAATLLKTKRRFFKSNPWSEHTLSVLALVTANKQQAGVTWAKHLISVTPGRRLSRRYHWAILWSTRWKQNEVMPLVFQETSSLLAHPSPPATSSSVSDSFPSQAAVELKSTLKNSWNKLKLKKKLSLVADWEVWPDSRALFSPVMGSKELFEPTWTCRHWQAPSWAKLGFIWYKLGTADTRQMHPVIAALTVGRRKGSVKTRG